MKRQEKSALNRLRATLSELKGGMVVCFSGGVDSGLLLGVAYELFGDLVIALTTISASLSERERKKAREFARSLGVKHIEIESCELENPNYAENPTDRCFYCKEELFEIARRVALREGVQHVVVGTNTSDLKGHRPSLKAAKERNIIAPLVLARMDKKEVRSVANALHLNIWDKPSLACLASRIPYGTPVTSARLAQVEAIEETLLAMGFRVFRARHHENTVRIELNQSEMLYMLEQGNRSAVLETCYAQGFKYVTLDLAGYRQGSMNKTPDPV